MPSSVTPPSSDPLSSLYLSDTFYTWFNKSNDLITKVNPIEVYSITADKTFGSDGITLAKDGNGNHTIGYVLPNLVPNGHTFSGHIHLPVGSGVSGHLINTYNGLTGSVVGVSTISGNNPVNSGTQVGNVASVPFEINGVTATTWGAMTLDAGHIEGTIGDITGPAGYVITSWGPTFGNATQLFYDAVSGGQTAFRIDSVNNRVSVNAVTGDNTTTMAVSKGNNTNVLKLIGDETVGADVFMSGNGFVYSVNALRFQSGDSGYQFRTGGAGYNNGTAILELKTNNQWVQGGQSNAYVDLSPSSNAAIGWRGSGNLDFKRAGTSKFGVGDAGEIRVGSGTLAEGVTGAFMRSAGSGSPAEWGIQYHIDTGAAAAGSTSWGHGAVWYQV